MRQVTDKDSSPGRIESHRSPVVIHLLSIIVIVCIVFVSVYHIPIFQISLFFVGLILFILLPGNAILHIAGLDDDPRVLAGLSLITGMAVSSLIAYATGIIGIPLLFLMISLGLSVFSLFFLIKRKGVNFTPIIHKDIGITISVLLVILVLLHFSHFSDLLVKPHGGYLLRNTPMTESIFHLGYINAAVAHIPPFNPYVSGYDMKGYHIGMHLLASVFCLFMKTDPLLMTYYFLPLMLFVAVVASSALFFYHVHQNVFYALFLGLLIFGSDLSFIPGLAKDIHDRTWSEIFCSSVWSLFTLNGIIASLSYFFCSSLFFQRFYKSGKIVELIMFSIFCTAAYLSKSSTGLHILSAAIIGALVIRLTGRSSTKYLVYAWISAFVVGITLCSHMLLTQSISSAAPAKVSWEPLNGLLQAGKTLNLESWIQSAEKPLASPLLTITTLLLFWLCALGARTCFVKYLIDACRRKQQEASIVFMAVYVVIGLVTSELISIRGISGSINNGTWLRVEAIIAASYFIPLFIISTKERFTRWVMVFVVILVTFPSTINFLIHRNTSDLIEISPEKIGACEFIRNNIASDAVIIEIPKFNEPMVSSHLSGRRTVLSIFRTFAIDYVPREELDRRFQDLSTFFGSCPEDTRRSIIRRYSVRYMIVPRSADPYVIYDWAERVFSNDKLSIYKISL